MFNFLGKEKGASVQEKIAAVEAFNDLIRERTELRSKQATLASGLERSEMRLAALPGEVQGVHDNGYRNQVRREVDATRPDLSDDLNRQLSDLTQEQSDLTGRIKAYRQELEGLHRTLAQMDGEHGSVARACRTAWESIADQVIATVPGDFPKQFLRAWVAFDRVRDGIHPVNVLAKIAEVELTTESKMKTIDELRNEFGLLSEYE